MRNCIVFKLLALLLCAASLMGMIGGAAGILTLVVGWHHTGYQKSPVQMAAITEKLLSEPPVRFI